MTKESVLWDIGANIGLYSIYAAHRASFVVSFEPMFENLLELKRNILRNSLSDKVCLIPLGLSSQQGLLWMSSSSEQIGGAFNNLESSPAEDVLSYQTLAVNENIVRALPKPTHIKIDVDGNELSVLESIQCILSDATSICIELDFANSEGLNNVKNLLASEGFIMIDRKRSEFLSWGSDQTYNTFWIHSA
jgi:FkbM family methyltransferase